MKWFWFLILSAQCLLAQAPYVFDIASAGGAAAAPIGTNGVLWYTNSDTSVGYIVDPTEADLTPYDVKSIAARNCTNMWSLLTSSSVTNMIFNGLGALTNLQLGSAVLLQAQADALWQLLVDNDGSNANAFIHQPIPTSANITNVVILSDRGYSASFYNPLDLIWFAPIDTSYTINGSSMFVGTAWDTLTPDQVYSVARGSDVHRFFNGIGSMTSLTNADFNGDGFDQGTVDTILSNMAGAAPANGFLDLQNTTAPTDGYSNVDYQTLTNNGWTVLLTP